ncbi:MAG: biopolymer transporter ExbD [Bacteroidota bacterium]
MGRPKIARKSTIVDMTAMCDVAFLLLTFFILATKFKPSEAVPVSTPKSVASKIAPENDIVMISMDKDGHAYISTGDGSVDKDNKKQIISTINSDKNLGLTESDINALVAAPFIGVPMSQLSQQAKLPKEQMNSKTLPGIPIKDTANNEMMEWMKAVHDVYQGQKLNL